MNNNNFWKNMKYLLMIMLILATFTFLVITQVNKRQKVTVKCDRVEAVVSVIDEKFSTLIEKSVSSTDESLPENENTGEEISDNSVPKQEGVSVQSNRSETILEPTKFKIGESVPLPSLPTHIKTFTDYRYYGLWYTPHYRLQQVAYTDTNGLRRFNEDYIVAMGAFYSTGIGDRFKVSLDSGSEFTVILGDGKHPADCDPTNMYAPCINYDGENCANILEFIIDDDVLPTDIYNYGSIEKISGFAGNIVKMEYLGRDNSADWTTYETR